LLIQFVFFVRFVDICIFLGSIDLSASIVIDPRLRAVALRRASAAIRVELPFLGVPDKRLIVRKRLSLYKIASIVFCNQG
jgi:hypothetical protein